MSLFFNCNPNDQSRLDSFSDAEKTRFKKPDTAVRQTAARGHIYVCSNTVQEMDQMPVTRAPLFKYSGALLHLHDQHVN